MSEPSVSVVIPARAAVATIGAALDSVLAQDFAGTLEVIVAVPPADPTLSAVEAYAGRVQVVANPDGSTPTGLNAAIEASSGSVIVRCDAHAVLSADYVRVALEVLEATGAAVVGGLQRAVGSGVFQRAVAVAQSTPLGVGNARYRLGGRAGPVDTVYLGVFRRDALEAVGGYSEDLERNQDYDLNWRIRQNGGVVWFDPRLVVDYYPRRRLRDLWRQYFSYGLWKRVVLRRYPSSLRWRQLAAPLVVIGLAASGIAAVVGAGLLAAVVPVAYATGAVLTGIAEAIRRREPAALLSPAPLMTMHLAWGVGFLTAQLTRRR